MIHAASCEHPSHEFSLRLDPVILIQSVSPHYEGARVQTLFHSQASDCPIILSSVSVEYKMR